MSKFWQAQSSDSDSDVSSRDEDSDFEVQKTTKAPMGSKFSMYNRSDSGMFIVDC